jgi:hypothetical protein
MKGKAAVLWRVGIWTMASLMANENMLKESFMIAQ